MTLRTLPKIVQHDPITAYGLPRTPYSASIHYKNPIIVAATCSGCGYPIQYVPGMGGWIRSRLRPTDAGVCVNRDPHHPREGSVREVRRTAAEV